MNEGIPSDHAFNKCILVPLSKIINAHIGASTMYRLSGIHMSIKQTFRITMKISIDNSIFHVILDT